ncbi:MAG: hypothetical protein IT424_01500 [Pirellulales bacterium]|nr:hypothetical protein [Pirellulales bacterium]
MSRLAMFAALTALAVTRALAAPTAVTTHGPASTSLDGGILAGDVISGKIATELAGDTGWHGANSDPLDKLPAFTDDAGMRGTGLTGLLNDFPAAGSPAKRIQYDLAGATDLAKIQILSGNNGKDGRVFSTTLISTSTNGGTSFTPLGYFQSDPSGTMNAGAIGSTLVEIAESGGGPLASDVTNLRFEFFAVDNTGGQMRDPFDGVNPYTGADDGLSAAFVSPLILEVDVLAVPEPATCVLLACAAAAAARARRRTGRGS